MCLGTVVVTGSEAGPQKIADVVGITTEGASVKVLTLFGEEHLFPDLAIGRVDMTSGVVVSLVEAAPR